MVLWGQISIAFFYLLLVKTGSMLESHLPLKGNITMPVSKKNYSVELNPGQKLSVVPTRDTNGKFSIYKPKGCYEGINYTYFFASFPTKVKSRICL